MQQVFDWVFVDVVVVIMDLQCFVVDVEICIGSKMFGYCVLYVGVVGIGIEFVCGGVYYLLCGYQLGDYVGQFELQCLEFGQCFVELVVFVYVVVCGIQCVLCGIQ